MTGLISFERPATRPRSYGSAFLLSLPLSSLTNLSAIFVLGLLFATADFSYYRRFSVSLVFTDEASSVNNSNLELLWDGSSVCEDCMPDLAKLCRRSHESYCSLGSSTGWLVEHNPYSLSANGLANFNII